MWRSTDSIGVGQIPHGGAQLGVGVGAGVVVAILAGVQDAGEGLEGGLGYLHEYGGLLAGLVPQDLEIEGGEQAGLEGGRQAGQDVPGQRELV